MEIVQSDFDEKKKSNWLAKFVVNLGEKKIINPMRHLLIIRALGYSPQSFFERMPPKTINFYKAVANNSYFFPGPYPCLNPVCNKYLKLQVKQFYIIKSQHSNHSTLHVVCNCGFHYARKGSDKFNSDLFRKDFVINFGDLWEQTFIKLWLDKSCSIRQISKNLNVARATVNTKAQKLRLNFPRSKTNPSRIILSYKEQNIFENNKIIKKQTWDNFNQKRTNTRKLWLNALKANPQSNRTQLKTKIVPNIARWLIRNDAEWLRLHQPPKAKTNSMIKKIDWIDLDLQLSTKIEEAAAKIKFKKGRPIKVTISSIIRELGEKKWKFRKISRIPISHIKLKEVLESKLEYQLRKIQYVVDLVKSKNETTCFYKVAKLAGIPLYFNFPVVTEAIRIGVIEINNNLHTT